MQKLHLVGFTPDLDGLILSTRKGAKSGSFVVSIDSGVLKQLAQTRGAPLAAATRANGTDPHGPRLSRPESQLGPREMQELLRGGWTLEEVAVEAGVDVDWVSRFAAPVLAEMRLVLDQARVCVFDRPRVGPSALPLAASVRRNAAERGVRFTDEDFADAWRAYQLDDVLWVVAFDYQSRGKRQSAEWTIDLETSELVSRGRLGTQLGHVQSARRRVNLTPPPKPKPKAAASRAARMPAAPPPARPKRTATKSPKATAAKRPRSRTSAPRSSVAAKKATQPAKPAKKPRATDPWREELRRRELERTASLPPPPPPPEPEAAPSPPRRAPEPEPQPEPEPELRPVAIIGPTIRMLARRPPPRRQPPPPRPERRRPAPSPEPITGPTPAVREEWPDLRWAPGGAERPGGRHGPLPPPEPLPVPEQVRERVATPLGQVEDDELGADTWFPPARPVFRGAPSASGDLPPRRRRSEPLRGR